MRKLILLLCTAVFAQTWAELPADYQRLSFICSSGSQSVDTGYYPGPTTRVTAEFSFVDLATTQQRVFGVVDTSLAYGFYFNGSRQYAWTCQDGSGNWQSTGIAVTAARRRVTLDSAQGRVTLVDVLSNTTLYEAAMNTAHTKTAAHALRIFSTSDSGVTKEFASIRLFALTIADSTGTVHSYVPCFRLSDGTVGLYDEIDGVFHGNDYPGGMPFGEGPVAETARFGVSVAANAVWSGVPATATVTVTNRTTGAVLTEGTDYTLVYTNNAAPGLAHVTAVGAGDYAGERVTQSFTIYPHAMRLPLAYSELEFAESAGGQVYDTGIHLTSNTVVDLDVTPTLVASDNRLLHVSPGEGTNDLVFMVYFNVSCLGAVRLGDATGTNAQGRAVCGSYNTKGGASATCWTAKRGERARFTVDSPGNRVLLDGRKVLELGEPRSQTSQNTVMLFAEGYTGAARVHGLVLTQSGTEVCRLVPCRRLADGLTGFYDLATQTFSAGTALDGVGFLPGPVVTNYTLAVAPVAAQAWNGVQAVEPALDVTDRTTGAALVAGTDYTVAFSGTSAPGTATAVVTGLGVYAGSSVTNTFSVYRTGGAFSYASWNVDAFTNGPSATGTIRWGQSPETPDALDAYQAFLADLGADWLGLNENAQLFTSSTQLGSRWAYFARYPATTPAVQKGTEWNPTYRTERFEVLSSTVLDFPTRQRSTYALEERVRVDGAYEAVFVNVALDAAPVTRDAQIAYLVNRYAEEPRVVISGGFATDKILADGTTRTTDWAALDPFAAAGYRLANTTLPTGPTAPTTAERTAATTHIVAKGFAVSDVRAPDPAATVTAGRFPLSDEAPLVCTLAPLASGEVAKPSAPAPQTYDGTGLVPVFTASDAYTVSAPACTNAGTYTVTVSLRDPTTTSWEDGTTADLTYTFTIEKAVNEWTTQPSVAPAAWERREGAGTLTAAVPRFGTLEHAWTQAELAALTRGTHALTFSVAGCANYSGLTTSVEVAVTETFAVQVAPDGATADIQFNCVDGARDVYLAYGSADCGGALSNWTHVVKVATVAAGATACTGIALPDDLGYETPYYRFLVTTPFDSTSYATNGLLAQWDAVENAGRGVHADAPATWTELEKGLAPTVSGTPVYNSRGVKMDGVYYQCEVPGVKEAINANAFSVQVMIRPEPGRWEWYQGIVQFGPGSSNRELILDTRQQMLDDTTEQGRWSVCGLQYRESGWNGRSVVSAPNSYFGTNVLLTVTTDASGAHLWFDGASACAFSSVGGGATATSDLFTLGWYINNKTYPMTAYAVRIYNRTLSAAEIAWNNAVDHERFADEIAEKSQLLRRERPILATVHGAATADVRFSAATRARTLVFAWGARDAGAATTNGWSGAAVVAAVPAGVSSFTRLALPQTAATAARGRFFLRYDAYLAGDYPQEKLIGQWDAIENAGPGVHEQSPSAWIDLVTGTPMDATGTPVYNATSITLDGSSYFTTVVPGAKDALNAKAFTVQAFLRPVSYVRYRGIYQFGEDTKNRELILDERREGGQNGDYTFGGLQYRENGWNGRSVITAANDFFGSNVLATVTTDESGAHLWFNDAATAAFTTRGGSTDAVSSRFWLGTYTGGSPSPMTLYAARVYARTLTAAEIAACCTLDRARFADGEPPWLVSESVKLADGSLIVIR